MRSGKTQWLIEQIKMFHEKEPEETVYVTSQDFKDRILKQIPDLKIEVANVSENYPKVFANYPMFITKARETGEPSFNYKPYYWNSYEHRR